MTLRIDHCFPGDCRNSMRDMLASGYAGKIQCIVTSPPYWGLRDYGVAGQLGQEPTLREFLDNMVEVFELCRELLADDGTCWVNMGDSYASRGGPTGPQTGAQFINRVRSKAAICLSNRNAGRDEGLKPKDLVGQPWRLAFELQQPRYLGRIKNEIDRVWLAAMIDGEGCFYVHKRPAGQHAGDGYFRKTDTYSPAFEVANTHKSIVDRCMEIAGFGSVICQEKDRRQPLWRWTVRSDEARQLAKEVYPYLVGKQQQCRIVCGMPNSGELAEAAWQAMKLLHSGSQTTVEFAEPGSCFGPGWYLRQDVIWAKPNPMPESVRDRCTKSHEYLFLLTKSERYFYDFEAMKEPVTGGAHARRSSNGVGFGHGTDLEERARGRQSWKTPDGWDTRKGIGGHGSFHKDGREKGRKLAEPGLGIKNNTSFEAVSAGDLVDSRNRRSVWTIPTESYSEAHFATFPQALVEPCILAGSRPGDIVFDPFLGSGTTAQVAQRLGRRWLGCELNPEYIELQHDRTRQRGLVLETA